jgi:hypothetical protein
MSSLIMLEKKDNRAPDDYMEKVLKTYNTAWGVLTIDLPIAKGDSISAKDTPPSLKEIKDIREVCDDPAVPIAYWFCKSDKPVHTDSMQPFIIVKDDAENPLVVALAAGEFKDYANDGAISGAAYYCIEYLNAQFEDLMERASGDIEKLDVELSKKNIIKNLQNSLNDGDYLILALADEKGSIHIISKSPLNNFDWGFTSDSLGWEKQEETHITTDTKVEETTGLKGMAARLAAKRAKEQAKLGSTEKSTDTTSVTSFVPTPNIIVNKTQDKEAPPKGATIHTHPHWFYQLDPERAKTLKDKQKRQAYINAVGYAPSDYEDCPIIQRKKPVRASQEPTGISTEPIKDFSGLKQIASTDPSKSKGEGPPIIRAQSLKFINNEILPKYYDVDKRIIKDPWKAPQVEAKMAMFSDVTGLGDALYVAPTQMRRDLIATPDEFINWTIEMSAKIIEQRKEINELRAKLAESSARLLKTA